MKHADLPTEFMNVVKALYQECKVYSHADGCAIFLFMICTGILQGCTLSGTLFVIAVDLLLNLLEVTLTLPNDLFSDFADDIALALH